MQNFLKRGYPLTRISHLLSINFPYSQKSLSIEDLGQFKTAKKYFQQRNIGLASEYLQKSLNILPSYGSSSYNQQYQQLIRMLAICYTWRGNLAKAYKLVDRLADQRKTQNTKLCDSLLQVYQILTITENPRFTLRNQYKTINHNFDIVKQQYKDKPLNIEKEIIASCQGQFIQNNEIDLWMNAQLKCIFSYIITSLISQPSFYKHINYNKLCKTFLKNTQSNSQNNIIKPLIILSANLLRNHKYLEAQGMLNYCLDKKKEKISQEILNSNHQYALLNLLLSETLEGVNRLDQSKRLKEQFKNKLSLQGLLIQSCLLESA